MKRKREFSRCALTYLLTLSLIVSTAAVGFTAVSADEPAGTAVWDGTVADNFAGGEGTEENPFLIENGGQLYKMVSEYSNVPVGSRTEPHTYFEITEDIDLDNQPWYKFATSDQYAEDGKYPISSDIRNVTEGFNGIIEGNGHTIYNLNRSEGAGIRGTGLIPIATQGAEIHKLNLNCGKIIGTAAPAAYGALIGLAKGADNSAPIVIEKCSVTGFLIDGADSYGGLVGRIYKQSLEITNCYVTDTTLKQKGDASTNAGQFCGFIETGLADSGNKITISNSYCVGRPVRSSGNAATYSYSNVYTNDLGGLTFSTGITVLEDDQMKGENAKIYMTGFDFDDDWQTVKNDYPTLCYVTFAGGTGTKNAPYLIENAEQLYKMVSEYSNVPVGSRTEPHTYFEITADIDLENQQWYRISNNDLDQIRNTTEGFNGIVEGNGHTISNFSSTASGTRAAGLIPLATQGAEIHNLNLKNGTISGGNSNNGYAALIGGAKGSDSSVPIVIENCSVTGFTVETTQANGYAGGLLGSFISQSVIIKNCYVRDTTVTAGSSKSPGAFIGYMFGSAFRNSVVIQNSYCCNLTTGNTSIAPTGALTDFADVTTYTNIYTDIAGFDGTTGITTLTSGQMKGEAAETYMIGFDFEYIWNSLENDTPSLTEMSVWNGKAAQSFAGGTGTREDPYLIKNGGQLYKMVSEYGDVPVGSRTEPHTYFEIIRDIDLGNRKWYRIAVNDLDQIRNTTEGFNGIVEGNGHTIYNLSVTGSGICAAGLIPLATQGAEIHNLNLNSGTISGGSQNNGYAALIGGARGSDSSVPIVIENCSVTGFTVKTTHTYGYAGGLLGYFVSQSVIIKNCYVRDTTVTAGSNKSSGAFIGYSTGSSFRNSVVIENCYCTSTAPIGELSTDFRKDSCHSFTNVYTDTEASSDLIGTTAGILPLTEQMKGSTARTNMVDFNFNTIWQAGAEGQYPGFRSFAVVGDIWNGKAAFGYASGNGSKTSPYIISTAEQLYLLACSDTEETENKYYRLSCDIRLADVYDGWEEDNPNCWIKKTVYSGAGYGNSFAGHFDGAGHTVTGLFYQDTETDRAYAYGLFPVVSKGAVIQNTIIDHAYIMSSQEGQTYAGAVAGYANVLAADINTTLDAVHLVNCHAKNANITAKNAASILGGMNRAVRLELCSSDVKKFAPNAATCINCKTKFNYMNGDVRVITSANAHGEALTLARESLLSSTESYFTDINGDGTNDIRDLVRLKKYAAIKTEEKYRLVFSEEFRSDSLNGSVWTTNSLMGVSNKMSFDNAATERLDGDTLTLSVKDNGDGTYKIHQGISTEDYMSFRYGKLEMRAKVPTGAGAFPSFWLSARDSLGYDTQTSHSTEVDVFEVFGSRGPSSTLTACIHKWYNIDGVKTDEECSPGTPRKDGNEYIEPAANRSTQLTDDNWHIFTFEWTRDKMVISMDDVPYYVINRADLENLHFDLTGYDTGVTGIFEQFLHIRINNHMYAPGGNKYNYSGEAEIDESKLDYSIDYIRLYQKNDGVSHLKLK